MAYHACTGPGRIHPERSEQPYEHNPSIQKPWRGGIRVIKSLRASPWLRLALLAVAIAFIALGVLRGEMMKAFLKAIYICLECVGLA